MAKYQSGQKIIQQRIGDLQREIDALKSTTPLYDVVQGDTYGQCLVALRDAYGHGKAGLQPLFVKADGRSIVRPLTFEETIEGIVTAYESGNKGLLNEWNDSCTGIAHKENSSKFKVVTVSQDLICLGNNRGQRFVLVDYAGQDGTELDTSKGKYNGHLTKPEVLEHPGWLESVRDISLLEAFRDMVFTERKTDMAMGYYVTIMNPQRERLQVLGVDDPKGGNCANDLLDLDNAARLVLVRPKQVKNANN